MILNRKNFSLIELLVVLAIIVILLATIVPAFFKTIKAQSIETAIREIGSKLKATRSYAITQREYTSLVFIQGQTATNTRYNYRAFRPCIVNSSGVFQSWVPDDKWEFIPNGVFISSFSPVGSSTDITSVSDAVAFSGSQTLKGVTFKPSGDINSGTVNISVGQGVYTGNGSLPTAQNSANSASVEVGQYNGRVTYTN